MPTNQYYGGYYPDPEEERRLREMDLTQDPEALAGSPPPTMDLTQDPQALQGSPDWQRMNQSRVDMRNELDNPPPSMDLTRDPAALNSPMQQQQMAQRAPQPPAAGLPMQGSLSSLLPQRDSQMDSRWRTAENNALDSSGYMGPQKYGVGEAVRDFAPMAVGGALDVLINHGRGLKSGAIIGAGMQANAQQQQNRDEEAKAAGSFASTARNQRESQKSGLIDAAYKTAQIENWQNIDKRANANLALHGRQTDLREIMQQYKLDPSNPEAVQKARLIQELSGVDTSGMSNAAQQALQGLLSGNQRLQNAEPQAQAARQGAINADIANAPSTTAVAAGKSAAETRARVGAQAGAERAEAGNEDIGNSTVVDPKVWASRSRDPTAVTTASKLATGAAQFDQAMSDMAALHKKNGTMVMPSGDQSTYKSAQSAAIGGLTTLFQTGVINEAEYKRYIERIPEPGISTGAAYGAVTNQDTVGDQIAGTHGEIMKIFDRGLGTYGRRYQAPGQQPSAASGRASYGPDADHPSNLGTAPAPKIPIGQGQARGGSAGPPPATAGYGFQPSGMADGSVYVTDLATGRRKRVAADQARQLGGGR